LTGTLWDRTMSRPLPGMKISFTIEPFVKIQDQTTNKVGVFSTDLTSLPEVGGTFKVQAHFGGLNQFDTTDSKTITMKIKPDKPNSSLEDHLLTHPTLTQKKSGVGDRIQLTNHSGSAHAP